MRFLLSGYGSTESGDAKQYKTLRFRMHDLNDAVSFEENGVSSAGCAPFYDSISIKAITEKRGEYPDNNNVNLIAYDTTSEECLLLASKFIEFAHELRCRDERSYSKPEGEHAKIQARVSADIVENIGKFAHKTPGGPHNNVYNKMISILIDRYGFLIKFYINSIQLSNALNTEVPKETLDRLRTIEEIVRLLHRASSLMNGEHSILEDFDNVVRLKK